MVARWLRRLTDQLAEAEREVAANPSLLEGGRKPVPVDLPDDPPKRTKRTKRKPKAKPKRGHRRKR